MGSWSSEKPGVKVKANPLFLNRPQEKENRWEEYRLLVYSL